MGTVPYLKVFSKILTMIDVFPTFMFPTMQVFSFLGILIFGTTQRDSERFFCCFYDLNLIAYKLVP